MLALQELGLSFKYSRSLLYRGSQRDLLLLVLFLYQSLPAYLPKTTIEFHGALDEEVTKTIELTNPSKRPISYQVRLDGSCGFSVSESVVRLEARGKKDVPIRFRSRFSKTVEGRVIFLQQKDDNFPVPAPLATPLVFLLRSFVHSRKPLRTYTMEANCYELVTQDIEGLFPFFSVFQSNQSNPIQYDAMLCYAMQ